VVGEHLAEANLAGVDSRGVMRVPQYLAALQAGKINLGVRPRILSETKTTAVIDGRQGFGQVVCKEAKSGPVV
jgi:uncharacterized oxidoreductase